MKVKVKKAFVERLHFDGKLTTVVGIEGHVLDLDPPFLEELRGRLDPEYLVDVKPEKASPAPTKAGKAKDTAPAEGSAEDPISSESEDEDPPKAATKKGKGKTGRTRAVAKGSGE